MPKVTFLFLFFFSQVVPLNDEVTLSKIHQTLRLRYFRDIILSDVRDESFSALIHSLIYFNNMDIINSIQQNRKFCSELFSILSKEDTTKDMKDEALKFVMQLCQMANVVQISTRLNMYRYVEITLLLPRYAGLVTLPFFI